MQSPALAERNRQVKYAKELGIEAPHKMKGPELAAAIAEAEIEQLPAPYEPADVVVDPVQEDDPFDDIDPSIEGDHLVESEMPAEEASTREGWLLRAVEILRPLLKQHGATVGKVAVSVGFSDRKASRTNGVCYKRVASKDKTTNQIFITPKLGEEDWRVLLTLNHELIHASDDCESGHVGHFAKVARTMGYINKLTSSEANEELKHLLMDIADELGPYPHITLDAAGPSTAGKKQTTRLLKMVCTNSECGLSFRITRTWLETYKEEIDAGWSCVCGHGEMMEG